MHALAPLPLPEIPIPILAQKENTEPEPPRTFQLALLDNWELACWGKPRVR